MKAFRNALLASCLEGARFFKDLHDVSFGWAIVEDIYGKVLAMAGESDVPHNFPRWSESVAYPVLAKKMSVIIAKEVMVHKTVAFGILEACKNPLFKIIDCAKLAEEKKEKK